MSDRPSDVKLELKDVVLAVKDVVEWYDLGLQLGLPDSTLATIAQHPDVDGRRRMMLSNWLQSDLEATWEKLAAALDAIDKRVIAENIRRQLLGIMPTKQPQKDDEEAAKRKWSLSFCYNRIYVIICWIMESIPAVRFQPG